MPGDGFSQTIARNGGDDNAFTTHDYTVFHEQIAKDRLRLAMQLEADRMANLDLSDSAVGTERDVVLAERRMRVDNDPEALMQEQAEAALHLSHPYGRPVIGWADEIRHIGRARGREFLPESLRAQQRHPDRRRRRDGRRSARRRGSRIRHR